MSESERRHGYGYNRVLIETDRILDPQFAGAVVFLSGAQIEMLRNVTQYLNRHETYVSAQFPGYYLTPTTADYDDILEIVADLEETLMGNPNTIWGFHSQYLETETEVSVGDPSTYVETDAVASGYVSVVQSISFYHVGGVPCAVNLIVNVGGANPILYSNDALPSSEKVLVPVGVTLIEGQTIQLKVVALPVDELATLRCLGYTMKVPE